MESLVIYACHCHSFQKLDCGLTDCPISFPINSSGVRLAPHDSGVRGGGVGPVDTSGADAKTNRLGSSPLVRKISFVSSASLISQRPFTCVQSSRSFRDAISLIAENIESNTSVMFTFCVQYIS